MIAPQPGWTRTRKELHIMRTRYLSVLVVLVVGLAACETGGDTGITTAAIPGLTPPVLHSFPVDTITETAEYTGTVSWDGGFAWSPRFGGGKAYTATVTLMPNPGFSFAGVPANFFTVAGALAVTNDADSGVVTVVFPATASVSVGEAALGGTVAYILQSGDEGYVAGEQRGLVASATDLGSGGIQWAEDAYDDVLVPGGTDTALGTGAANTASIVAQNGPGDTFAAGLAQAHDGGIYSDWYLPSIDELGRLYDNRAAIGGFSTSSYWSSTADSATNAQRIDFNSADGATQNFGKAITLRVRAVRVF